MRPRSRSIITGCASALLFVFSLSGTTQPASPQPTTQPPPERETKQIDLSGIWLQGNEEWEIKHNPQQGTITIIDPIKHLPGRYVEYVGTVKGSTITATYHVTDPAVFNPDLPEKIRREHLKDQVKWTLKLELTKEGKLKGIKGIGKVSYNKKTLKITRVTPVTNQVALVRATPSCEPPVFAKASAEKKAGAVSKGAPPTEGLGPSTERRPDGTEIVTWPNGLAIETQPDGTRITRRPDGGEFTRRPDGTTITRLPPPAESSEITVHPNGLRTVRWPDGREQIWRPDGTRIERWPGGREQTRRPDGTRIERWPDRVSREDLPDGTSIMGLTLGSEITTELDFSEIETRSDGTTVRRRGGFGEVTRNPDGSWTRHKLVSEWEETGRPDGTRIQRRRWGGDYSSAIPENKPGAVIEERPDGTRIVTYRNRSLEPLTVRETRPDGTTITRMQLMTLHECYFEDHPDGTSISRSLERGRVVRAETMRPDGTRLVRRRDGRETIILPDGREIISRPPSD